MVVPAHSLVAPCGAMGGQWSLAAERFNVFSFMSVFS